MSQRGYEDADDDGARCAVEVTHHGKRRVRERIGLPQRAAKRLAARALAEGRTLDRLTPLARSLVIAWLGDSWAANPETFPVVYKGYIFIFTEERRALVTCYELRGAPHLFEAEKDAR